MTYHVGTAAWAASALISAPAPVVRRWAGVPLSVGCARRELGVVLREWGLSGVRESAELVLSELMSNSLRHARLPLDGLGETRFERVEGGVRIEVHDAGERLPVLQQPSADAESGRGLALVDVLTGARWGVGERDGVGKVTWAVVSDDGPR